MNLTVETLEPTLGPRAEEVYTQTVGSIHKMRKLPFLKWSIPRVHPFALIEMSIGNLVARLADEGHLPIPEDLSLDEYIHAAASAAFAEWRTWFRLDSTGHEMESPRNPQAAQAADDGSAASFKGFDLYRTEQMVSVGKTTNHAETELPVDLSMLTDVELEILSGLSSGLTQQEVAEYAGFEYNPTKPTMDHRAFVQAKLRTIRRKVCGPGIKTQAQAAEWLANRKES